MAYTPFSLHHFRAQAFSGSQPTRVSAAAGPQLRHCNCVALNRAGVTGQNIPPAGVYPGILWPKPIYTQGYILAYTNSYPSIHNIPRGILWMEGYSPGLNMLGYNLTWAALTTG